MLSPWSSLHESSAKRSRMSEAERYFGKKGKSMRELEVRMLDVECELEEMREQALRKGWVRVKPAVKDDGDGASKRFVRKLS